ncbi:5-formyltetrahydrofolate cyclo-ligase [Roseovarius sp. SCSIO 43702]|uniref:5-formyltetrahydrofolate cyclo-ligase n=1 Tax=Roseovarius sp. SCSIO 43702 TaxID=2823043 RepID=UPI002877B936|nr:5-formyltetrahydrofolate cyclo-ligase [Roseovarius sp. SCSIO 43702]
MQDEDTPGDTPCHAHLMIGGHAVDPETARDVARFRKGERARLYEAREAWSVAERQEMGEVIGRTLDAELGDVSGRKVAVYWPIRCEPNLRDWMTRAHEAGAHVLLPVVVEKDAPLIFRRWAPGCAMERGIWNIPVPTEGAEEAPDLVISPLLGLDREGYRLGNGGGYYDRTLAALRERPEVVGVGWPDCGIDTIFPMPWDVPMDKAVLGDGDVRAFDRDVPEA